MLLSMVLMTTFDIIINPDKGDMEICGSMDCGADDDLDLEFRNYSF
jgi:hypothetical protein